MRRLVLAEYKKLFFLKFSKRYLSALIIASSAFGVMLSLTTRMTTGRPFSELRPHEVLSMNLLGVDLGNIMLIVFTAISIHREFSTGYIQVSLSNTGKDALFYRKAPDILWIGVRFRCSHGFPCLPSQSIAPGDERYAAPPPFGGVYNADAARGHGHADLLLPARRCRGLRLLEQRWRSHFYSWACSLHKQLWGFFQRACSRFLLPVTPQAAIHNLAGMSSPGPLETVSLTASVAVLIAWVARIRSSAGC